LRLFGRGPGLFQPIQIDIGDDESGITLGARFEAKGLTCFREGFLIFPQNPVDAN
jgi:hypothetical protein